LVFLGNPSTPKPYRAGVEKREVERAESKAGKGGKDEKGNC